MNVVAFCRRNRHAVLLATAFLAGAGIWALFRLPSNIYPELNFPRVVILVHGGNLSPEQMLLSVTRPLEEASATVLGVRRVRSKTIRGSAEISVWFRPDMDMQVAHQLVQARVGDARASLPPGVEIEVERLTPAAFPVVSLILNGDVPASDLRDLGFYVLRPLLSRIPEVGEVEVQASDTREISVVVDPERLAARRLSLPEVAERLRATNQVTSVGRLDRDHLQHLILATAQFTSLEQIRDAVIADDGNAPVRLRDIADVSDGVEDRRTLITGNGRSAALVNVSRQIGGDILAVAGEVKRRVGELGGAMPRSVSISLVYDLGEFVADAIRNVGEAMIVGGFFAILILLLFLREPRATIIAGVTLPLSILGTFFFLKLAGGSLDLMSLGGLAIAIGLVIDDAVVIVENVHRHLALGQSPALAAESGTRELIGPVVFSTATTLVVFLPLGLLTGVVGAFFRALCLTLGVAVTLSLVYSLTLIPLLSERFLSARAHHASAERFIEPVNRAYERAVRWALSHRRIVVLLSFGALAGAGALYGSLETGFLPEMDEGGFVLDYMTAPGTSLAETDRILKEIESRIAALPETAAFSRRTGVELGIFATEQNSGDILVRLAPRAVRERSAEEVIGDLRAQIRSHVPGVAIEFVQILQDVIGDLEGTSEPVEIKIFGPAMPVLERLAAEIGPEIRNIPGIVDYQEVPRGNPELVFRVDAERAARAGLTVEEVSRQVSAGLLGIEASSLQEGDRTIGIRLRFPDAFRGDLERIRQFPVVTPERTLIPLHVLAEVEAVRGASHLSRENQRLMIALTARLEARDLGGAIRDVRRVLRRTSMPVGCTWEIGGQYETQQGAFRELLAVLGLALAAVFAVLVAQFRALRPALVILSAVPLSLLGVFAALKITATPLNVSSLMGVVLLVGLVVKNGIILFEYVQRVSVAGDLSLHEALVRAGRIRVRPILMTTLATLFGLAPLALGLGSGAELQKPLAIAVIGGLSLSTVVTLVAVPVLFSLLGEGSTSRSAK